MGDFALLVQLLAAKVRSRALLEELCVEMMRLQGLRQYLFDLQEAQLLGVLRAVELKLVQEGEILFHKGDASDQLYVVLQGAFEVYDGHSLSSDSQLTVGKVFGDRGLARKAPRQYTCRAVTDSAVLTLGIEEFKLQLEQAFHVRNDEKLTLIDRYLPSARSLPLHTKDRLAAAFLLYDFPKGRRLSTPGRISPVLYLLRTGECIVKEGQFTLVRLGSGSWLGEEALLGKSSAYFAEVNTETATAFVISIEEITRILPESVLDHMRRQYVQKQRSRVGIAAKLHNSSYADIAFKHSNAVFGLAHPAAKRRLIIAHQRLPSLGQVQEWTKLKQELHHYTPCWPDGSLSARN